MIYFKFQKISSAKNFNVEVEQNVSTPVEQIEDETTVSTHNYIAGHKRKLIATVWNDFTKVKHQNGNDVARCNWCKKELCGDSSKGTSHLRKYLNSCIFRKKNDRRAVQQSITAVKGFCNKTVYKFDQEKSRRDLKK